MCASLGGLIHEEDRKGYSESLLSDHMRSRKEVGDILRTSTAKSLQFSQVPQLMFRSGWRIISDVRIPCLKIADDGMSKMGLDKIATNISR